MRVAALKNLAAPCSTSTVSILRVQMNDERLRNDTLGGPEQIKTGRLQRVWIGS